MTQGEVKFMGLRFDNHVSVGHIFTTLSVIIIGTAWAVNTDNRISNLERSDIQMERVIEKQKTENDSNMVYIRNRLDYLVDVVNKKVDRQ